MRIEMQCPNPNCRATWSIGVLVEVDNMRVDRSAVSPTMLATVSVKTRRLPVECPACGEVRT